jgi:hypothetical protein
MKKALVVSVCFFILTVSIFGQAVNKAQYRAIDPFDYKLDEYKARRGTERKFKSVVEFVSEIKDGSKVSYLFASLDKHTLLPLEPNFRLDPNMKSPSAGQAVTVYYTVIKTPKEDNRVLDAFEDNRNKDEKGLGVEKSPIPASSPGVRKAEYEAISAIDYRDDALYTQEGDDDRKFVTELQFVSQEGIIFKFTSPDSPNEKLPFLTAKVMRRYPQYSIGQKMKVFFTATKEFKDFVILDDIELMR